MRCCWVTAWFRLWGLWWLYWYVSVILALHIYYTYTQIFQHLQQQVNQHTLYVIQKQHSLHVIQKQHSLQLIQVNQNQHLQQLYLLNLNQTIRHHVLLQTVHLCMLYVYYNAKSHLFRYTDYGDGNNGYIKAAYVGCIW